MKNKRAFAVYGRHNGKPSGFVGLYATKKEAHDAQRQSRVPCTIKQENHPEKLVKNLTSGMSYREARLDYLKTEKPDQYKRVRKAEGAFDKEIQLELE